jgi:hypothetical protein
MRVCRGGNARNRRRCQQLASEPRPPQCPDPRIAPPFRPPEKRCPIFPSGAGREGQKIHEDLPSVAKAAPILGYSRHD